jgi:mycofactocin precursor
VTVPFGESRPSVELASGRYRVGMENPTIEPVAPTAEAVDTDTVLVEEELLVEEISIDGMCGVY